MNKAFKFRIYPNHTQKEMFAKTFGCTRFIYNKMLEDKIKHYVDTKEMLNNTPAQYKDEYSWLREVDALSLSNAQMHLQSAYRNFFRTKRCFPRFKKKSSVQKYTTSCVNNNIQFIDGKIKLPKIGLVKIKQHRKIPEHYKLKSATITKSASGKYFVSVLFEYETDIKQVEPQSFVGLDFSMPLLYVDSNGYSPSPTRYFRENQSTLAKEQRKLSNMKRGSRNYSKQKIKVARVHEKIANKRKDFLHKQSNQITNDYDCICIEDLNMQAMSQALNFGKSVHDNGWGMFVGMMTYKTKEKGKQVVKIDKWFPSTKTCSNCGKINNVELSERTYECSCGISIDRDLNAAKNILTAGTAGLACLIC